MSIATERLSRVSVQIGEQEITFETGKLAKQADGAVVVRSGETMVLATAPLGLILPNHVEKFTVPDVPPIVCHGGANTVMDALICSRLAVLSK